MKNNHYKNQKGFTLVEMMIYIGLFAIIMSGAIVSIYGIIGSSSRNTTKAMVQEEGSFLVGKIDWALTGIKINSDGTSAVTSPIKNATGATLVLTKFDGAVTKNININILGGGAEGNLQIDSGSGSYKTLNNSNVTISGLTFTHGTSPEENISADFTVNTKTSEGLSYSQEFSTIKYLRK